MDEKSAPPPNMTTNERRVIVPAGMTMSEKPFLDFNTFYKASCDVSGIYVVP